MPIFGKMFYHRGFPPPSTKMASGWRGMPSVLKVMRKTVYQLGLWPSVVGQGCSLGTCVMSVTKVHGWWNSWSVDDWLQLWAPQLVWFWVLVASNCWLYHVTCSLVFEQLATCLLHSFLALQRHDLLSPPHLDWVYSIAIVWGSFSQWDSFM